MEKTWVVAPKVEGDIVAQLLANRGVADADRDAFLLPNWEQGTYPPTGFTQMPRAVERVFTALEQGEPIVIHGDYDADGVCGSSLLFEAIRDVHKKMSTTQSWTSQLFLSVFLPDREKDGYGVAMHTIDRIADEGAKLLLTVDCGIANADQLDRAHERGVDVIVCDHHQLGDRIPPHAILLHPLAPNETYPNKTLCGTGVAFKLASALIHEAQRRGAAFPVGYEKWLLDFVAIATVTDVMPLVGENRVLEHFGLSVLRKTRRHGLRAILASAGTAPEDVNTETIGFRIGPRLNAAGRLSSAKFAFDALTASTAEEATVAAATLESLNTERQKVFAHAYDTAKKIADAARIAHPSRLLVVWQDEWLPGIVGLIAGRLVTDYGVPAFAFAKVGEHYVGSGRSIGGLHLVQAMESCGDIFLRRGGHPQACGLTIATQDLLHTFRESMSQFARTHFGDAPPSVTLQIDAELPLEHADWALVEAIARCAPFGEGNRPPLFVARNVEVIAAETMGSTKAHLRMSVFDDTRTMRKIIGFGFGDFAATLKMGDHVDVVYAVEVNEWKGRRELQYRIVDIRLC